MVRNLRDLQSVQNDELNLQRSQRCSQRETTRKAAAEVCSQVVHHLSEAHPQLKIKSNNLSQQKLTTPFLDFPQYSQKYILKIAII